MSRFRHTMLSVSEYKRRSILPLLGLGLAAYYFFVFVHLERHAAELDVPLRKAWQGLAASLDQTNATSLDFAHITNQLAETRQALAILTASKKKALARLALGPALQDKMRAPFELVEYQNRRSQEIDTLGKLAKEQQVAIEPAVFSGLPEHTADIKQPELFWPALAFIDGMLTTAIQCKVSAIHSLEAPLALTNAPPTNAPGRLVELPLQLELTGPVGNVLRFVRALPLRAEERKAAGLPEAPPDHGPLFIDRLILKKQAPEKTDEVRVWLRVVGFVIRE